MAFSYNTVQSMLIASLVSLCVPVLCAKLDRIEALNSGTRSVAKNDRPTGNLAGPSHGILPPPNSPNVGSSSSRTVARSTIVKLFEEPDCKDDIQRLCKEDVRNNFAVLECIQDTKRNLADVVSDRCSHLLWNYKFNLTRSGRIEELAKDVCEGELSNYPHCVSTQSTPGNTISCLSDVVNELKDDRCRQYLLRMAAIVFSDFRLVGNMMNKCQADIDSLKCGRIHLNSEGQPHSQGSTIECLTKNSKSLGRECHKQILRLAEIQADDFHLDRPLYFACREDREKFCEKVRAGEGRVYRCLMKHKTERLMSKDCADQLSRHQQLIVQDYHVSRGLVRACRTAITDNSCRKGSSDDNHDVKLSRILLCLEGALKNAETAKSIDGNCREEMLAHRRLLLEDYKLSPDLMVACDDEIDNFCGGGLETGGRTLHCLMKYIRSRKHQRQIRDQCKKEIENLVKETDAGEDWRADPVLFEACHPVVETVCKDLKGGHSRVMHCLMRHLNSPDMTTQCEAALLEIQYFVSRDWKLDAQLFENCYNDSVRICNAKKNWAEDSGNGPNNRGAQVLPCLFRYVYHPNEQLRLTRGCIQEIQRVMHERAAYVELHPEIELVCMDHLAQKCSTHTGPGEEIACLQDNLDTLNQDCRDVIGNYTAAEAKDTNLNSELSIHCASITPKVCKSESLHSSGGNLDASLMDCLIAHKNTEDMRSNYPKCRAVIEHFQLLSLKDYTFSPRFKELCNADVAKFCTKPKPKNKADVIECLSTQVRQDVLADNRHRVSKLCRQQLRQQLLQRHENIQLDPKLQKDCDDDAKKFCKDVHRGKGAVLECLRGYRQQLSKPCHKRLFIRDQEQHLDPKTDFYLVNSCSQMIQQYCHDVDSSQLFSCLKRHKGDDNFDQRCRTVIIHRMIEKTTDSRLNPTLVKACKIEMTKFCSIVLLKQSKNATEHEVNGQVTECLKEHLPTNKLSNGCRQEVMSLTRSAALDYRMDPILVSSCADDMKVLCPEYVETYGKGRMEECLKLKLESDTNMSEKCKIHVAHIIETQRADIHVDPVLNEACGIDDSKYCDNKERGQHLACLFDVLDRNPSGLKMECREKLRERREMFNTAMKVSRLHSLEDLVNQVSSSPERNYILLVLITVVGVIFIMGLFCGRTTKRYKLLKDR